jgi:tripartite ATP-independent transporter DctP family solute receptor
VAAAPSGAAQEERVIRVADYRGYLAPDHPSLRGLSKFAELVGKKSNGRLVVRVVTESVAESPAEQIKRLQDGDDNTPELMLQASIGLAGVEKCVGLIDLPFTVANEKQADALLDGPFGLALFDRLKEKHLVGLAWWENGFRQITTSTAPMVHASDFQGLKIRAIPSPVFVESFMAIGASPIPIAYADLHSALEEKRVDAQDNFDSQILNGKLYEVQSFLSVTRHSYSAMAVVAADRFWNTLSSNDQAILLGAAWEAGLYQRELIRKDVERTRAELKAKGMKINEVSPEALSKLADRASQAFNRITLDYDPALTHLYKIEFEKIRRIR